MGEDDGVVAEQVEVFPEFKVLVEFVAIMT